MAWFRKDKGQNGQEPPVPQPGYKPDLSRVRLVPPEEADVQAQRNNYDQSSQRFDKLRERLERQQEAIKSHPLRDMPNHLRYHVERVLDAVAPEFNEDGELQGLTKEEARAVLEGALKLLDTKYAPEFINDDRQHDSQAAQPVTEQISTFEVTEDDGWFYEDLHFPARRHTGTIINNDLETYFHLAVLDEPTAKCIEGSRVATLIVNDGDGGELARFEGGTWELKPKGNMAHVITDMLIRRYDIEFDRSNRANFMGHRRDPANPRVMDNMHWHDIGEALNKGKADGNWEEVKAALEAPVNTDDDTKIAARIAELKAEDMANANTRGGGKSI